MSMVLDVRSCLRFAVAVWITLVSGASLLGDDLLTLDGAAADPGEQQAGTSVATGLLEELEQAEQLFTEIHFIVSSVYEVETIHTSQGETLLSEESFAAWRKGGKIRTETDVVSHSFLHDNKSSDISSSP